ncbi:MAG TPA: NAD(P)H-binding protein [Myxococcaceae bacterium]|nr:NAD(P)H-binding protein [Myxococcaceae bacterium]
MARIFLAGASGVIGRRLVPMLVQAGHHVTATTRTEGKTELLRSLGATPAVVDVFDTEAPRRLVLTREPEVVVDQLTALPDDLFSLDEDGLELALRANPPQGHGGPRVRWHALRTAELSGSAPSHLSSQPRRAASETSAATNLAGR